MVRQLFKIIAVFALGCMTGLALDRLLSGPGPTSSCPDRARQDALQIRTEEYLPPCEELGQARHTPTVTRQGEDYFLTIVHRDTVRVIGLNLPPDKPPLFAWWGASLAGEQERCREQSSDTAVPAM